MCSEKAPKFLWICNSSPFLAYFHWELLIQLSKYLLPSRTLTEEAGHMWIQWYMPEEYQLTSYSQVDQG